MFHQTIKNLFASPRFEALKAEALAVNEWFTASSIDTAVGAILEALPAQEPTIEPTGRRMGVVCAGNIPLVGFWDLYSALVAGYQVFLKPSRRDPLMRLFGALAEVVETLPPTLDAVMAMGSDATMEALARQFPASRLILRGSEASFALLTGEETADDLQKLGDDLFTHAGLGCRSVVHLFLPEGYDLRRLEFPDPGEKLPQAWRDNVLYERAIRTLTAATLEDREFFLLLPHVFSAPLRPGLVGYSYYQDKESLDINWRKVKCYTALAPLKNAEKYTPPGTAQHPTYNQVFQIC